MLAAGVIASEARVFHSLHLAQVPKHLRPVFFDMLHAFAQLRHLSPMGVQQRAANTGSST